MRALVFAYHEIGYVCLEELLNFGAHVPCLFTHEDDPSEEIWFRRPAALATERGIAIHTPQDLREERWGSLISRLAPDVIFSFYYRMIIPGAILAIPKVGAFNLHGSLLPRFRGRCPVNWVLIEGEKETGLTLHVMEEKADTGPIVAQRVVPISFEDTAFTLFTKMVTEARNLMREVLPLLGSGAFVGIPQSGPSSYYGGRRPEDGLIDWRKSALAVYNLVRATTHPYPGAFTHLEGRKLYIWAARPWAAAAGGRPGQVLSLRPFTVATGDGAMELERVQLDGEEEMDGVEFAERRGLPADILGG